MATKKNDDPEPTTTVPHDDTVEAGGRKSDPTTVPQDKPDTSTTVPHDDA